MMLSRNAIPCDERNRSDVETARGCTQRYYQTKTATSAIMAMHATSDSQVHSQIESQVPDSFIPELMTICASTRSNYVSSLCEVGSTVKYLSLAQASITSQTPLIRTSNTF